MNAMQLKRFVKNLNQTYIDERQCCARHILKKWQKILKKYIFQHIHTINIVDIDFEFGKCSACAPPSDFFSFKIARENIDFERRQVRSRVLHSVFANDCQVYMFIYVYIDKKISNCFLDMLYNNKCQKLGLDLVILLNYIMLKENNSHY